MLLIGRLVAIFVMSFAAHCHVLRTPSAFFKLGKAANGIDCIDVRTVLFCRLNSMSRTSLVDVEEKN